MLTDPMHEHDAIGLVAHLETARDKMRGASSDKIQRVTADDGMYAVRIATLLSVRDQDYALIADAWLAGVRRGHDRAYNACIAAAGRIRDGHMAPVCAVIAKAFDVRPTDVVANIDASQRADRPPLPDDVATVLGDAQGPRPKTTTAPPLPNMGAKRDGAGLGRYIIAGKDGGRWVANHDLIPADDRRYTNDHRIAYGWAYATDAQRMTHRGEIVVPRTETS